MDYIIIGIVCAAIIALLTAVVLPRVKAYLASLPTAGGSARDKEEEGKEGKKLIVYCPVCRSPLPKGVDLFTRVFRPMDVHDQHCVVYGCPQCYAPSPIGSVRPEGLLANHLPPHSAERSCPVCHAPVPPDGYLTARLFNKTKSGKKHLTVTGCPKCARIG